MYGVVVWVGVGGCRNESCEFLRLYQLRHGSGNEGYPPFLLFHSIFLRIRIIDDKYAVNRTMHSR